MKAHHYDLSIRVLVYKEGSQFVAHALELDILGYGATEALAKKNLEGLLNNQLSFAACHGAPEMVSFPAPKKFFDRWEAANQAKLRGERLTEKSLSLSGKPSVFVYTQEDLKKLRSSPQRTFARATDHQDLVAVA